jgi:hypothetical protein
MSNVTPNPITPHLTREEIKFQARLEEAVKNGEQIIDLQVTVVMTARVPLGMLLEEYGVANALFHATGDPKGALRDQLTEKAGWAFALVERREELSREVNRMTESGKRTPDGLGLVSDGRNVYRTETYDYDRAIVLMDEMAQIERKLAGVSPYGGDIAAIYKEHLDRAH